MKQNKYDDDVFFEKYQAMDRSVQGLEGAGEWPALKKLLPELKGRRVLDLGCGFGWHCQYALDQGASSAVGVDISRKMLEVGRRKFPEVTFIEAAVEEVDFPSGSFDLALSSLAGHYLSSFDELCRRTAGWLRPGGCFVFSVEHPVFTAQGPQDWCYDREGGRRHWPVDSYFDEGPRQAIFLGEKVVKHHRTLTSYFTAVSEAGFEVLALVEPRPGDDFLARSEAWRDELRRPMMLIMACRLAGGHD